MTRHRRFLASTCMLHGDTRTDIKMTDQTIEFIRYVENYPCLYNNTLSEYSRKDITGKAWADIGRKMNWTVTDCKEKWRNIRNGFVRSLKTQLPSGSSTKTRKPYYLQDIMEFVIPYIKPVKHSNDSENVDQNSETSLADEIGESSIKIEIDDSLPDMNEIPSTSTIQKQSIIRCKSKHKTSDLEPTFSNDITKKQKLSQKESSQNARKMFLMSLLPDVEYLSDNNMRLLKIEMLNLVQKYNLKDQEEHPQNYPVFESCKLSPTREQTPTSDIDSEVSSHETQNWDNYTTCVQP